MMHLADGEQSYQPYGRDESECNFSISRGGLNEFLIRHAQAAGVRIESFESRNTLNDRA